MTIINGLHFRLSTLILATTDAGALFVAIITGLAIRHSSNFLFNSPEPYYTWTIATFVFAGCLSLFMLGAYRKPNIYDNKTLFITILASHILMFLVFIIFLYIFQTPRIWIGALVPSMIVSLLLIYTIHYCFNTLLAFRRFRKKILVIGSGHFAQLINMYIKSNPPMIELKGFVSFDSTFSNTDNLKIVPLNGTLSDKVRKSGIDEIIVAIDDANDSYKQLPWLELLECRLKGSSVVDISTFFEQEEGYINIDTFDTYRMIFSNGFKASTWLQLSLKRMVDVAAALMIFLFACPIFLICCAVIFIDGPGRVFYRQDRIGLGGRVFSVLKFRTMKIDAEADGRPKWASADDDRVTCVGAFLRRTKFDELPQLWNVIRGEMSVVGPRPERPYFVKLLDRAIPYYSVRHCVKPGLTGWAQINFPYSSSIEEARRKLEYDLYYVKNYSVLLDVFIILQTLRVVLWPAEDRRSRNESPNHITQSSKSIEGL